MLAELPFALLEIQSERQQAAILPKVGWSRRSLTKNPQRYRLQNASGVRYLPCFSLAKNYFTKKKKKNGSSLAILRFQNTMPNRPKGKDECSKVSQLHLSAEQFLKIKSPRRNKYKAIKTVYNNITYDSKQEADRARELDMLLLIREILKWERQIKFDLHVNGKKIGKYIPDFKVTDINNKVHYEECKGFLTPLSSRSIKHFRAEYPDLELRVLYARPKARSRR